MKKSDNAGLTLTSQVFGTCWKMLTVEGGSETVLSREWFNHVMDSL